MAWALGGGLGHLTRIRAWHHTHRPDQPITVATVSDHADDPRASGGLATVALAEPGARPDPPMLRRRLGALLADPEVTELVVDAFPCGLVGELDGLAVPDHVRLTHLARLLRWEVYQRRVGDRPPYFDRIHRVEPLPADQERWLRAHGTTVNSIDVHDPPTTEPADRTMVAGKVLVVHAGPVHEVEQLIELAARTGRRIAVACPSRSLPTGLPPTITPIDLNPIGPLLRHAALVVAGGGWNTVRQTADLADRRRLVPFPRRLDDQALRLTRPPRQAVRPRTGPAAE